LSIEDQPQQRDLTPYLLIEDLPPQQDLTPYLLIENVVDDVHVNSMFLDDSYNLNLSYRYSRDDLVKSLSKNVNVDSKIC
jgi:hypothetical protein